MPSPIQRFLAQLHAELAGHTAGQVATYIPELAKADPSHFGIAIATVDGCVYEVGHTRELFTLQSISKPLVYGVALEDRGPEVVRRTVGVEPSGEAFNSISLEPGTGRPMNPMINAGAIATTSLVAGATQAERQARVLDAISAYAGRPLTIDEAVFESERATGHRNRAIGHLLRNYEILTDDPEPALDLYFRQCSVQVHCRDLALMAATLANGGVNPATGVQAVQAGCVGPILSVMATCGVYDFSGEWIYRVGLPAKSGVGGGIVAVLPGQLGIGVYSPALDERGNSARGVKACEAISRELGLHFLQPPRASVSTLRARYTLAQVRSKRRRPEAQARVLAEHGAQARVYELQGDLRFTTLEPVLRDIINNAEGLRFAVLDFKRVANVDEAAGRMLADLVAHCAGRGQQLVLTRVRRGGALAALERALDPRAAAALIFQPQLDAGLEWCERALLKDHSALALPAQPLALQDHPVCKGLGPDELAWLQDLLPRREYEPGTLLARRGEAADAVHFLVGGEVSVLLELPGGGHKRLSTLSAGMSFGELGLLSGKPRSADVRADSTVLSIVLDAATLARIEAERPALANRLLRNLLLVTIATAQQLTSEVAALEA